MKKLLTTGLFCLALLGCGKKAFDLSGNWELTLPKGAKFHSPIERVSENTYRIPAIQSLSGVYELKGDKLVVTGVHARAAKTARKALGVRPETVVSDLVDVIGNTGAAHPGILLAGVLDEATPGGWILRIS